MAGTFATYVVEIDWDNDGTFTASGEVVTTRVLSAQWRRGRDRSSQFSGRSIAGKLQLILNNESGDYSPFNSGSPLTGSLLPNRQILIRTTNPTSTNLWCGYISAITPRPSVKGLSTVLIEGVGALGVVNQEKVNVAMLTNIRSSDAISTILDEAMWPAGSRDISAGQTVFTRFWIDDRKTLGALREVEFSEKGFIWETKDGKIAFNDRHKRLKTPHITSVGTYTDNTGAAGTLTYTELRQRNPADFIFNQTEVEFAVYTTGTTTTLWVHPEVGDNSPFISATGTAGSSIVLWANYPNETSSLDTVAADSWVTPTATVDFKLFEDHDESGTNVTTATKITVVKFGQAMKQTFENTGTQAGFITFSQARGVPLTQVTIKIEEQDTASQTTFGPRRFPNRAKFIPSRLEAEDSLDDIILKSKDPLPNLTLTIHAHTDSTHMVQTLIRDINDRITVIGTNNANLGLAKDFFIETEFTRINPKTRTHITSYELSDADGFTAFAPNHWIMDTGKLGTDTELVY